MPDFGGNTILADSDLVNSSFKSHRLCNSCNVKCHLVNRLCNYSNLKCHLVNL